MRSIITKETMAAIDKLYIRDYHDYNELRNWAIAYYPELLFYFYDTTLTYESWEKSRGNFVSSQMEIAQRDYEKLGKFKNRAEAIVNLQKHYRESADYQCPVEQARFEVDDIIESYNRDESDWADMYSKPCLNTPLEVDRRLKWICPVPCVREYLHKQCGVNPKWEWLYKLFWKGKKHF
jgi:hypothetical protein